MAQEIVTWCDLCETEHPRRGNSVGITIDTLQPVSLDLCHEHNDVLLGQVYDAIAKYGRRVDKPERPAAQGQIPHRDRPRNTGSERRPFKCLLCEVTYATGQSVARHYRQQHGLTGVDSSESIYGLTCPICSRSFAESKTLGHHASQHEGAKGTGDLFTKAEEIGDPYGIVMERRSKLGVSTHQFVITDA